MSDPALDLCNHTTILNQVMMMREVLHLLTKVMEWLIAAQSVDLEGDLNRAMIVLCDQVRGNVEGGEETPQELEATENPPMTVLAGSEDNVSGSGEGPLP